MLGRTMKKDLINTAHSAGLTFHSRIFKVKSGGLLALCSTKDVVDRRPILFDNPAFDDADYFS